MMAAEGWYIYIYLRRHVEEDQHPPVGGRAESLPFHPSRMPMRFPARRRKLKGKGKDDMDKDGYQELANAIVAQARRKGTVPFRLSPPFV